MKKYLLMMSAVLALMFVSCDSGKSQYKIEGEQMAAKLDSLCKVQNAAAAIALDDSIRNREEEISAMGDSAAISAFSDAVKEALERNAPYIAKAKVEAGATKDEAVKPLIDDVLNGEGSISTVTKSINEAGKATGDVPEQ